MDKADSRGDLPVILARLAEAEEHIARTLHGSPMDLYRVIGSVQNDLEAYFGSTDAVPEKLRERLKTAVENSHEIGLRGSVSNQERVAVAIERTQYYQSQIDSHVPFVAKSLLVGSGAAALGCLSIIANKDTPANIGTILAEAVNNLTICMFAAMAAFIISHIQNSTFFTFWRIHTSHKIDTGDHRKADYNRIVANVAMLASGLSVAFGISWFIHTIREGATALTSVLSTS